MKQILAAACAITLALVLLSVTPMQARRAARAPDFLPDPGNPARGLVLPQRFESASVVTFARSQGAGIAAGAPRAAASSRALSFPGAHGSAFGIANAAAVRLLQQSAPDEIGIEHVCGSSSSTRGFPWLPVR
jgi:hypothetical protein